MLLLRYIFEVPMYDELVDIVNEHDQVIGVINRSEMLEKHIYTRIVLAFIVNHEGKHAILRRTADKYYSPLHLALVGGGVQSGETYEQAIKREIAEEVNLDVSDHELRYLGIHKPHEGWQTNYGGIFKAIYEVQVNENELNYNREDFCELYWLLPHEILAKKDTDKLAKGLIWLLKKYYCQ